MLKIYLDQKDYIRIAWGLLGKEGYKEDVLTYEYLLKQIELGNVRVYYSDIHLHESTGYAPEGSELFDKYVDVMQSLTNGNCLIVFADILKREINIFLADKFRFTAKFSRSIYPYGKKSEAVLADIPLGHTLGNKLTKKEKRIYANELRKISKDKLLDLYPGSDKMQKSEFVNMFTGSYTDKHRIKSIRKYLDILFSIEDYFRLYRNSPIAKGLNEECNNNAKLLMRIVTNLRKIRPDGKPIINKNEFVDYFLNLTFKENSLMGNYVTELSKQHGFELSEAVSLIKDSYEQNITALECKIYIYIEYYKKHLDKRNTMASDNQDVNHMHYLPYVDIYVCDRFFSEVSKNIAPKFETKVLQNLKQLREYLQESL